MMLTSACDFPKQLTKAVIFSDCFSITCNVKCLSSSFFISPEIHILLTKVHIEVATFKSNH